MEGQHPRAYLAGPCTVLAVQDTGRRTSEELADVGSRFADDLLANDAAPVPVTPVTAEGLIELEMSTKMSLQGHKNAQVCRE